MQVVATVVVGGGWPAAGGRYVYKVLCPMSDVEVVFT